MSTLPDKETKRIAELADADRQRETGEHLERIKQAVFSGTLDKETVEDALAHLMALVAPKPEPKVEPANPAFNPNPFTPAPAPAAAH
jgi:hypothetical protein